MLGLLEEMIPTTPTHASQEIRCRVWMLENRKSIIAATATNTAVHVPWRESAFNAIEMLTIADPATKIQTVEVSAFIMERSSSRCTNISRRPCP